MESQAAVPVKNGDNPVPELFCTTHVEGWTVHAAQEVGSTNMVAAKLPPWNAVCARRQTAGRGRFQRTWISDEGGLWLSAVVPIGEGSGWRALPLGVGLAVSDALGVLGVRNLRMRWPNDLLVDNRKLAGLLLDQFEPGTVVAGIGVNVYNQPEQCDPALKDQTARLADLVGASPALPELASLILCHLRRVVEQMNAGGFGALIPEVNRLWGTPRKVELDLDGVIRRGIFGGVDSEGNLILLDELGGSSTFGSHQVRHLKENN